MKARGKNVLLLLTGMLVGLALAPTAAHAVSELLTAIPSTQIFYVDGQRVELEAYGINGYNYVKLRDVGQLVDFNVCYDSSRNAAIIEPDKPYTGEDVAAPTPAPSAQPSEGTDYAAQANPTVFTGELNREVYNAIRDTVVNRDAILAGSRQPTSTTAQVTPFGKAYEVVSGMGSYPLYEILHPESGTSVCNVRYPEAYQPAAAYTQSFVDALAGKSQREQVEEIAWYVCNRISYAVAYPSPAQVLTSDSETPGACMAYAQSFQFLCDRAGIPCILVVSDIHQWNEVYVEGRWWAVDLTADDVPDVNERRHITILEEPGAMQGTDYIDVQPDVTAFTKEVLIPGSTK